MASAGKVEIILIKSGKGVMLYMPGESPKGKKTDEVLKKILGLKLLGLRTLWLLPISQFGSNSAWVTCAMKKPKYNNLVILYPKINSIRKPPK